MDAVVLSTMNKSSKAMQSSLTNMQSSMQSSLTNMQSSMQSSLTNMQSSMQSSLTNMQSSMQSSLTNVQKYLKSLSKIQYIDVSLSKKETVSVLNVTGSGYLYEAFIYYAYRNGNYGRSFLEVYVDGSLIFTSSTSVADNVVLCPVGIIHPSNIHVASTGYFGVASIENNTEKLPKFNTGIKEFVGLPYTVGLEGRVSPIIHPIYFNSSFQIKVVDASTALDPCYQTYKVRAHYSLI